MVSIGHSGQSGDLSALRFAVAPHIMVLEARFYNHINDMLIEGVKDTLSQIGATYEIVAVPGALEIPSAIQFAANRKNGKQIDAYVVLGCVIRGETTHYEIVSEESARGIMGVALRHNLAVGNGILTVENEAQAIERADKSRQNKGGGAAYAALSMLSFKQSCGV